MNSRESGLPMAHTYFAGTEVALPMLRLSGIMIPMNMIFALITGRMLRNPTKRRSHMKS
jgi:hypothetical protein